MLNPGIAQGSFLFPQNAFLQFYKHMLNPGIAQGCFLFPEMDPNSVDAAAAEDDGGGRTLIAPPGPHPIAPRDKILPLGKPSLPI